MTLHVLVSASLQALLRPPAAQRQERFRSPAPTHCPHGASVDSRWPLLCRLYWPIVWGVTPPLIPDSWGEKNLQHPLATQSAGDAVIEGGRKGGWMGLGRLASLFPQSNGQSVSQPAPYKALRSVTISRPPDI